MKQNKQKKRKEKKERRGDGYEDKWRTRVKLHGGYLNFLNNLWFWFLEKLGIKEFPIQFLGEKKFPNQRTSSSGFMNQPERMGSLHKIRGKEPLAS
jgi:hypothetical protein